MWSYALMEDWVSRVERIPHVVNIPRDKGNMYKDKAYSTTALFRSFFWGTIASSILFPLQET